MRSVASGTCFRRARTSMLSCHKSHAMCLILQPYAVTGKKGTVIHNDAQSQVRRRRPYTKKEPLPLRKGSRKIGGPTRT